MCDGGKVIRQPLDGRRFVDRSRIVVAGGQGGSGCVSFFRDTRTQWGGPDGGPGGDGGSIIIRASGGIMDLARDRYTYIGGNGLNGKGSNLIGRAGQTVIVDVPVGTLVKVFPETEGYLGPEALEQQEWGGEVRSRKDRRNRQTRIKEVDDDMPDTQVSAYMQRLAEDENRRTTSPSGQRASKFQRGKLGLKQQQLDEEIEQAGEDAKEEGEEAEEDDEWGHEGEDTESDGQRGG
eukprot:CAMPEP_0179444658 /NCGR_PEP_ID=MMETSP0799-20121207/28095_1 /TAXON_ID=46947 /ORGANISM="Geminigera cryophila, Strain CCMP2564" /LENGTH=234 /DNA_ID=CAMNT_0021231903 /DNA_START=256 /DNA_END=956 /DNA_ORIENTATION=+